MRINSRKLIKLLNELAPTHLAESWDNVGFQIGNINKTIGKIMVCLEVTDAIIDEAIGKNVDLIISHHPLIFKALKQLSDEDPIQKRVRKLIQNDINLYCAHTNLDIAQGGLNDYLASLLDLERVDLLTQSASTTLFKIAVFVPETHVDEVHQALMNNGAGHIGNYSEAGFRTLGLGTFKPLEGSAPFIGTLGELEKVEETKLETVVTQSNLHKVINAMLKVHPYEEVAYDIYKLDNQVNISGLGRIGYLKSRLTLGTFIDIVKAKLDLDSIKYVGDLDRKINKVAICTGAGASLMNKVVGAGCEVFVTGDVKYHEAQTAEDNNLAVIDAGHFETENIYSSELKRQLDIKLEEKDYDVQVIVAESSKNPLKIG